jgi:hypothetical protein
VRARKVVDVIFYPVVACVGGYGLLDALFPRIHNPLTCGDSVPKTAAQASALAHARTNLASACSRRETHCKFEISDNDNGDGLLRIMPIVVDADFFEGCTYSSALDVYVYDGGGRFIRTEESPYPYS